METSGSSIKELFKEILNHLSASKEDQPASLEKSGQSLPNKMINIYKNIQGEKANSENQNLKYYHEYCNIFVANVILLEKVKQTIDQKEELIFTLKRLQNSAEQVLSSLSHKNIGKRRRYRRKKDEIVRAFKCPISKCKKEYGSEGSLQQHLKTKHPKYFETQIVNNFQSSNGSANERTVNLAQPAPSANN